MCSFASGTGTDFRGRESMGVEHCVEELRAERQRLQVEVRNAKTLLENHEAALERVDAALAVLTGSGKARKQQGSATGHAVKTQDVVAQMKRELRAGPRRVEDLGKSVGEHLKNKGRSLLGYTLRYKQALKDRCFLVDGDAVTLAAEEASETA